jgi:hypothetical protein
MDRRSYAAGAGTLVVAALAGCPRPDGGGGPTVEGADLSLAAGETAAATVQAENVDRLRFGAPFLDSGTVAAESFEVSPRPDATAESFPPEWRWTDPRASVEATMTVRADAGAAGETVGYTVTAALGDREVTEEYEIAVGDASG